MKTNRSSYDAILVPGGGSKSAYELHPWVEARFDRALEIHQNETVIALSAGTVHKPPPLDSQGFPVFESRLGAAYLMKKGMKAGFILCETASYDTIGNAYFSRVFHVEPRGFKRLLIITSTSHLPRTKAIFQWVYSLTSPTSPNDYILSFEGVPDRGMSEMLLKLRLEKERSSLANVLRLKEQFYTLADFHQWLFSEHGAYSTAVAPYRLKGKLVDAY